MRLRRVRKLSSLGIGVAVLATWWLLLRPLALGGPTTYVVIRGDSMQPGYTTGDLVVMHAADTYKVGDIVGYRVPAGELGEGLLVVHRIVGGDAATGFVLQGDNNPAPDPWLPTPDLIDGTTWIAVPGLGRLVAFLHQPAALAALAVSLLVGWQVGRSPVRRPERRVVADAPFVPPRTGPVGT
jgi:signal peptidase I